MKKLPPPLNLNLALSVLLSLAGFASAARGAETKAELKDLSINGGWQDGKARLVIEALLDRLPGDKDKLITATALQHSIQISGEKLSHSITARIEILQGDPKEVPLMIVGEGEIRQVKGEALQDWSVRQETNETRTLVLRPRKGQQPLEQLQVHILAEQSLKAVPASVVPLALRPAQAAFYSGYVKVAASPELDVQAGETTGLVPIEIKFLPSELRSDSQEDQPEPLAFRFQGAPYSVPLEIRAADPELRAVVLRDFKLSGQVSDETVAFTLTATARVRHPKGGSIHLLSGRVALTDVQIPPHGQLRFQQGRFILDFDQAGEFPLQFKFNAAVTQTDGWNALDFRVAPSVLQPIELVGLAEDTQFRSTGAARPVRTGPAFVSYLPPSGVANLSWKEVGAEASGRLFFAAEMLSQVSVSPGLMRQAALLDFKVMQGELSRLALRLHGTGEVTRVQGDQVLAWTLEPITNSSDRRLLVQLNQPQKDRFALQVQMQTPLGAFPQAAEPLLLRPEAATRFAGYYRIVNEGAVRLEVAQASGLSQISPDQFPESDLTRAFFRTPGNQRFAFRFSGADFGLRIQADQILPELTASQVLAYHLGENELAIDVELELDVREAPLRELLVRLPKGYAPARLTVAGLSDYFLREPADQPDAELRLVFTQPVSGRQVVQARFERNQALSATNWVLPRVEVVRAKSTRGHIGISADAGFRLTPEQSSGLTEIATAFFPRKVAGLQAAFRLSDANWQAAVRVERLPQTVQADAFHLFSIAEGIAYGSSLINYVVSGAPVAVFRLELSTEYFNVEFTGKDIRNWQKSTNGYIVQLHTPVSGAYTLLATYERPFRAQGETLAFTGARPLDAQPEQGHTLVISAYQFQVQPVEVSAGLLPLEAAEVPPEYRLLFDAPILAAYRYTSRPFNLRLALSPLAQGDSLAQVVDRASLTTHISKAGQVVTEARYFVKNRGRPHFRLSIPESTQLWSASVNGVATVPVTDAADSLIPLPQRADPNAVLAIDLKLASRSSAARRVSIAAPRVSAPVMLAEWKLLPDTGQRLIYHSGSLTPAGGEPDVSGFAGLARTFTGSTAERAVQLILSAALLIILALLVWRWTAREGVYRFSLRHVLGLLLGLAAFAMALGAFANLGQLARQHDTALPKDLTLLAPVQQPSSALTVQVVNIPEERSVVEWTGYVWPVLLALIFWLYGGVTGADWFKSGGWVLGWVLLAWAGLRAPNGAVFFVMVLAAFLVVHVLFPWLRRLWRMPAKPKTTPVLPPTQGPASAAVVGLAMGLLWLNPGSAAAVRAADAVPADTAPAARRSLEPAVAESVIQEIRVEEGYAMAKATIRWQATQGRLLPLLFEPAVLTHAALTSQGLKLVQGTTGGRSARQLLALETGSYEIELRYQLPVVKKENVSGLVLPTAYGLVNKLTLTLVNLDVDVVAPQAVSVRRDAGTTNSVVHLVLSPVQDAWIGWRPRSRDVKREKPVFYAEMAQLYIPSAGVIEGLHHAAIRPAQGELTELVFAVPSGATITDVLDASRMGPQAEAKSAAGPAPPLVSLWRFDPDTRKLRVTLQPGQSRPFALVIRSQVATGPLPCEQAVGLISAEGAAGQVGQLGLATGNEVQLDSVTADVFAPINIEDYPSSLLSMTATPTAGLALRRAYRYADPTAKATLKASAVEADVRVETQDTLSLGEDRTVLATTAQVTVTRAGIFRLSFLLPATLEVESISGPALSHWTELRTDAGRVITLHLQGKTEGQQQFAITLTGPGVKTARAWRAPQVAFREASKQRGTVLIVPEQGMRLQVSAREGVTQLDPQKAGVRQKGVLAFSVLQTPWTLTLDIEQVAAWIQVTSLQHATVNEALVKVAANLQYQIENTGLKALRVSLSTNAENVRFQGDQVADFRAVAGAVTNGLQQWEIKLHRRMIGPYLLQATYQIPMPEQAPETTLRGLLADEVNLQRGFVTVQTGGRLQVRVGALPPALQPTEWQSIPRALQKDLPAASANFAFRLVEPAFQLPLQLDRHPVAKLLPARVNSATLSSAISDDGVMLTHVRLEMIPGDKRLLHLTLPQDARFWFAFVNQNGVWPWREQDQILIPLEPESRLGQAVPVEFFYSSRIGAPDRRRLDLALLGPKFDLPLENITWRVYLNEKWQLADWAGSLQLDEQQMAPSAPVLDVQSYLQNEANTQREKTRQAEQMLAFANSALEQGNQQQARRAFQAAYGLSQGNDAFNEDARVQLNNVKLQQALVGLNVRQATVAGDADGLSGKLRELRSRKDVNFTPQDAKAILERNSSEDNAAFVRLAQRMIQQQDAAVSSPAALRATIPEQGRLLTFRRAVLVDPWAELRIDLEARAARTASGGLRFLILAGTGLGFILLMWAARSKPQTYL